MTLPNAGADRGASTDCPQLELFLILHFILIFGTVKLQELIEDPVVAADGHTYERRAILDWFTRKHTSPMLNTPLEDTTLRPNHSYRSSLQMLKDLMAAGVQPQ